jgi:putative cell wall-binding protein/predicted esterase
MIIGLAAVVALLPATPAAAADGPSQRVGDSTDVVTAAVDLSQAAWDDGEATIVVLARNDVFADALAGAALAGTDGPVLFTPGGASAQLAAATRDEIERVLPPPAGCGGAAEIALLGGTGAVSVAVEDELEARGHCVRRIAGENRVLTAVRIAEHLRDTGHDTSTVLLSRSDNWPDSATGSAFAAATGHPILVTSSAALEPAVAAFLDAVNPSRIVLLGGTAALSPEVERAASAYGTTERVAGTSRDATAVAIAERLWAPRSPTGVTIVNGFVDQGWAYAIAGAVNAAIEGAPELYVDAVAVPASVEAYLESADDEFSLAVGPPSLLPDSVIGDVEASRGILTPPGDAPMRYRDEVFDEHDVTEGVEYGRAVNTEGEEVVLEMDVFEPRGDTVSSRPAVVFVHGGGFYLGGTGEFEVDTFTELVRRGYVVASISYRTIPAPGCSGGPIDTCIEGMIDAREDAQNAVRFLHAHAAEYGIDRSRVAMMGTSAGAVTTAHVGYLSEEQPDAAIRAAVVLAGANYLSPMTAGDTPALLIWGTEDSERNRVEAQRTVDTARERGIPVWSTVVDGAGHDVQIDAHELVEDQTASFLWWQLDLRAAAT